ncbi:GFA family protein [Gymnodinialimonas hymeniacidonis]|uniref:GFA family protein n=1 Tax=Gymnodinialimonas hymeniacidonis TaxID=3126508 RepID=UPI0034C6D422
MANITGSCLCGAIEFQISGPLRPVIACHCTQCRKTSGHHVAATSAARDEISMSGEPVWYASSHTAKRGFCGACGSNLFWDGGGANISIFAGTLDGDPGLDMAGHIFCDDKGGYYELTDDLPKAGGYDPNLTTQVAR